MKKSGFTMLEVMLSLILFSLMVWVILWAYTNTQRANTKMANTQTAIQVSENFLEMLNDKSLEYQIDTSKYAGVGDFNHFNIVNTGVLYLSGNDEMVFYRSCDYNTNHCVLSMDVDWSTGISLVENDVVNVDYLNFEIYPDQQYVNINITTSVRWWETLYKSGITLSTSLWFKHYENYIFSGNTSYSGTINHDYTGGRWIYN